MHKSIVAVLSSLAIAVPVADASAAIAKKKVVTVTKTVTGASVEADRWGPLQVALVVKKTTTTNGSKKTVTRKITAVRVPTYPNHTNRSVFINQQALPILVQETLTAQLTGNIQMVSGATDTSYAFAQSLQAALIAAKKA
jgi:uncharacterized protein with FMN-binding domain